MRFRGFLESERVWEPINWQRALLHARLIRSASPPAPGPWYPSAARWHRRPRLNAGCRDLVRLQRRDQGCYLGELYR